MSQEIGNASMLCKAIELASKAHSGQLDRSGNPYILHPLRVMNYCDTPETRMVAVLHDVIEFSDCDGKYLKVLFSDRISNAVESLSWKKSKGETRTDYLDRIKGNDLALAIKVHDIEDNLMSCRMHKLEESRVIRYMRKYRDDLNYLYDIDVKRTLDWHCPQHYTTMAPVIESFKREER